MLATTTRPTAAQLNAILTARGWVQIDTGRADILFSARDAGAFHDGIDGALYVETGRMVYRLSNGDRLLVAIRTSHTQ